MLSNMMISTPQSSASWTIARVSHSTSILKVCWARERRISIAFEMLPAILMWLSFTSTQLDRLKMWLWAPPTRTAYFWTMRSPGQPLRVSVRRTLVCFTRFM